MVVASTRGGHTGRIIFHGDRNSQYMSGDYRQLIARLEMVQSVGRTGVCFDNAVAESFWSSLKRELVQRYRFAHRATTAGRSSLGSTATTTTASTRASATCRPSSGNSYTVNTEATKPRNQRDRPTGGTSAIPRCCRWLLRPGVSYGSVSERAQVFVPPGRVRRETFAKFATLASFRRHAPILGGRRAVMGGTMRNQTRCAGRAQSIFGRRAPGWHFVAAAVAVAVLVQVPASARALDVSTKQRPAPAGSPAVATDQGSGGTQDVTGPVGTLPDGVFPSGLNVVAEVPSLRTANSRTYLTSTGSRVLMSYAGPVNYLDTSGVFQPIDDSATANPNGGWHNAANSYQANVPATIDQPVTVTAGASSVGFTLQGASSSSGSPGQTIPVQPVAGSANQNQVSFAGVFPNTDASYTFGNAGLEETLSLASNTGPDTYTWSLSPGSGLSAHMTDAGSVEVTSADGATVLVLNAPSIKDANNLVGPAPAMTLSQDGSTLTLSLVSDAAWLSDPARAFPVAVDPTITIPNSGSECELLQTVPNTSYCSSTTTYAVGYFVYTGNLHTMFRFDNLTSVPYDSLVQSASFNVYEQGAVGTSAMSVGLSTIANKAWSPTTATWNDYNAGASLAWSTPGGDFTTTPGTYAQSAGTGNGWIGYNPVQQVQAWVSGEDLSTSGSPAAPNEGFMLTADGAANAIYLTNWQSSTTTQWPYLSVQYTPRIGRSASLDVLKTHLDDKTTLGVNVANGDLSIDTSLFNIRGVGLPTSIDQDYDSLGAVLTSMHSDPYGAGWSISPSFDQPQLVMQGGGVMDVISASGTNAVFTGENYVGQWTTSPPGFAATGGIVTSTTAQITFNQSRQVWHFTQIAGSTTVYRLSSISDRNGNAITYGYYAGSNRLWTVTDTEGRVVTFNYLNGVANIADSTGRSVSFSYSNPHGLGYKLNQSFYGSSPGYVYGADSNYNLNQITDPAGNITTMQYDSSRRVTKVTRVTNNLALTGLSTLYAYSPGSASAPNAGVSTVTDPNGHVTYYSYDPRDQVTGVTDALGHAHTSAYSPQSSPMSLTNALTQITQLGYDTNNNLNAITSNPTASGQTAAATAYDFNTPTTGTGAVAGGASLASSSTDAQANCASFAYDANGNQTASYAGFAPGTLCDGMTSGTGVTSVQNAYQGDGTTTCGGQPGELCSTTSGGGNVTNYSYDSLGQLIQVIQPGGSCSPRTVCTTITYDSLSRPLTVTDGKNQQTTYTYDAWDRITQILYNGTTSCSVSAGTCIQFVYDVDGNVTSRVDKTGTTTFVYDTLNRLTEEDLPSALNHCSGSSGIKLSYDDANNLTTYCDAGGMITYTYDIANRNVGVAYGTGSCTPGAIVQPCTAYAYDDANELTGITYPTSTGNMTDALVYDGAGHQTAEVVSKPAGGGGTTYLSVQSSTYTNVHKDMTLQHTTLNWITGIGATNSYDSQNRLIQSAGSGSGSTTYGYTYDGDGNMIRETIGYLPVTYTYSPSDSLCWGVLGASSNACLSAPSGANQYTYDNDGNQTGNTAGESISYNSVNQTTSMNSPSGGSAVSMAYTGTDSTERTAAGSTTFANSIFGVAESTTSGTNTFFARNATGRLDHITIGGTVYFPYYDGAGSIAGLFDTSGNTAGTYTYDPYGGTTVTSGSAAVSNPFRFKGGYQDTTSFYKFGTRFYNPSTASWNQADANQGTIQSPSSVNKFVYAGADPVNSVDPSGRCVLGLFGSNCDYVATGLSDFFGVVVTATCYAGVIGLTEGAGAAVAAPACAAAGNVATGWLSYETTGSISGIYYQ